MPVLYVSQDGTAPSGITTYGYQVLEGMPDAHMVLLNAAHAPASVPPAIRSRVHCVPGAESHDVELVADHLSRAAAAMPGEVVVLPNTGDTPWAAAVAWMRRLSDASRARFRVIGIVHSDVETQYAGAIAHASFAAAWIGVSRRCTIELRQRLAGRSLSIHELRYPMAVPETTSGPNLSEPLRLVYAGRLEEPQKRISRLAAVLDALAGQGIRMCATVAGDGPAAVAFAAAIQRSRAAGVVGLVGALDRPAMAGLLARSDVFLLTSDYEGLPLALLEAMAAGVCPVVMKTDSGTEDVLISEENAVVVSSGSTEAMVEAVRALDQDRSRLERLKAAARVRIARDFAPGPHFARLAAIIELCFQASSPDPETVAGDATAEAIASLVSRVREVAKPVAVFGAGMFGRKLVDACMAAGLAVTALLDSDPARGGSVYRGLVCRGPDAIVELGDAVVVVGSLHFAGEIARQIAEVCASAGRETPIVVTYSD